MSQLSEVSDRVRRHSSSFLGLLRLVVLSPVHAFTVAVERKIVVTPLVLATAVAIIVSSVAIPRTDYEAAARERLDRSGAFAKLSPGQIEDALVTARRAGVVSGYLAAAGGPGIVALVTALALWLGLRVVGARPGWVPSLVVAAWGLLPVAFGRLLLLPALAQQGGLRPGSMLTVAPWSAAYYLPAGVPGPLASLAASTNLFALWSVVLLSTGMAVASQASRARASAVVAVLWALQAAAGMTVAAL